VSNKGRCGRKGRRTSSAVEDGEGKGHAPPVRLSVKRETYITPELCRISGPTLKILSYGGGPLTVCAAAKSEILPPASRACKSAAMNKVLYFKRLAAGAVVAAVVTVALGILVMWMNGFIVDDKPSSVAYTPCVFGEQKSEAPKNPFAKDPITVDCVPPGETKPLFRQWFDTILSRRDTEQ